MLYEVITEFSFLSSVLIRSLKPFRTMSTATPMALAKPNPSVPPWDLTTIPLRPRNIARNNFV